jgi:hypothetical protein
MDSIHKKIGRPTKEVKLSNKERQKRYLANPDNLARHKERQKRYRQKQSMMAKYIKDNNIILSY